MISNQIKLLLENIMLRGYRLLMLVLLVLVSTENQRSALRADEDDPIYEGKHVSEWILMLGSSDPIDPAVAESALNIIGPPAEAQLIHALKHHKNKGVRAGAARTLGRMQTRGKLVLPALLDTLNDASAQVRRAAGLALCFIVDEDSKDTVPALTKALKHKDPCVRKLAACALAHTRRDPTLELVPSLIEAVKDKDSDVRAEALSALEAMGPTAKAALPVLHDIWKSTDDPDARFGVVIAISDIDPKSKTTLSLLIKASQEKVSDPGRSRSLVIRRLEEFGAEAKAAVGMLNQALRDPEALVQVAAARALSRITPEKTPEMARLLIAHLKDKDELVRAEAIVSLFRMGPKAKEAVAPLTDLLKSEKHPLIRSNAVMALEEIDPEAAVEPLNRALRDPEAHVRVVAADALSRITPEKAPEMIRLLIAHLKDKDANVRADAANSLARMGPKAKEAIAPLSDLLKTEKVPHVRSTTASALEEIDPEAAKRAGVKHDRKNQ
jgi:HEAT repeat protein